MDLKLEAEYLYEIEVWRQRVPAEYLTRKYAECCGPQQPLLSESWYRRNPPSVAPRVTRPIDCYVFSKGEPARRDITKVNGLPYRPKDVPWPRTTRGENMTFLLQVRLSESPEITGAAPGGVLLVFCDWVTCEEMVAEWYPLGLGLDDLICAADVPKPTWTFLTGFGLLWRTVEYPRWPNAPQDFPVVPFAPLRVSSQPSIPEQVEDINESDIQFSINLWSLVPAKDTPFPWCNVPEPIDWNQRFMEENKLNFTDTWPLWMGFSRDMKLYWHISKP